MNSETDMQIISHYSVIKDVIMFHVKYGGDQKGAYDQLHNSFRENSLVLEMLWVGLQK